MQGLTPAVLGEALSRAPDPELARVALARVGEDSRARETLAREDVLPVAVRLLGISTSAADFLVAHPEETLALADCSRRARAGLEDEASGDVARAGLQNGLRIFRRRAMLRVAARDLAGGSVLEDIVGEISDAAEVCLALAATGFGPGFSVIGLGKLGGAELNYSSDVDLIFIGDGDIARFIGLLSEPTAEGIALRVDTALRPGGRSGVLSRSIEATVDYYGTQAATWERQALIKARPVAGDPSVGREFVEAVSQFVYPAELAPAAIDEVRQTKVRLEEYIRARGKELTEVKRGRGGIRDVEFAVQLLQIVHGRRDPKLREPNTLLALQALASEGYVAHADATEFAGAYRFLRTLEHRLQIVHDLQTHELPPDAAARLTLARSLGLADAAALASEYERQTSVVRGLHERLFYRPLLEAFAGERVPRPGLEREATEELLAGLGFDDPPAAYEVFAELVDPATRLGKVIAHVFPVIAPTLAVSANPDQALTRFERIVQRLRLAAEVVDFSDTLAGDSVLAKRLASLASASSFATDLIIAEPSRVLALAQTASEAPAGDISEALVRITGMYAARELSVQSTGRELTSVAERVIDSALSAAIAAETGLPFAVIGLGKLGAGELNFASDLDVVFVYEGDEPGDFARAASVAERTLAGIRDAGWEPDPDLRPEGRNGPLARSMGAFLEYWQRYAQVWEFQSLLRARFVAGDATLGRRFELNSADFAFPENLPLDAAAEILRLRRRIEKERIKPREAGKFHFKLGYGSLADVQFAVEFSLMRYGGTAGPGDQARRRGTLDAIETLVEARVIEDSTAHALGDAFVFLSDVKNTLEVDKRVHAEALPVSPNEQASLARRLGYEEYPRQAFLDDYVRITRRARLAMERIFAGVEE